MTRFVRRIAALAALAALAFGQLAVSAHACMLQARAPAAQQAAPADCCDKGKAVNICERHCDYGASSLESHAVPPLATAAPSPALRTEPAALPRAIAPRHGATRIADPPFEPRPLELLRQLRI